MDESDKYDAVGVATRIISLHNYVMIVTLPFFQESGHNILWPRLQVPAWVDDKVMIKDKSTTAY